MSIDSDSRGKPTTRPAGEEAFAPLPVWSETAQEPEVRAPASKVPPRSRLPQRQADPQTETILKALGAVLIVSALVVAAVLAIPNGGGKSTPTATSGIAVVMAPDNVPLLQPAATPSDDLVFNAQNAEVAICIDAGHGGKDLGFQRAATSSAPAMNESYFNLAIAK